MYLIAGSALHSRDIDALQTAAVLKGIEECFEASKLTRKCVSWLGEGSLQREKT
jgi:hypothetical protein